jgi:hypothetical protein
MEQGLWAEVTKPGLRDTALTSTTGEPIRVEPGSIGLE